MRRADNMNVAKVVCVLMCVVSVTGFFNIGHPHGTTAIGSELAPYSRWISLSIALLYLPAFCGIQWRVPATWKFGFAFLGLSCLQFMVGALMATAHVEEARVAQTAIVLGGAAVTAYWCRWWYLQKSYFARNAQ